MTSTQGAATWPLVRVQWMDGDGQQYFKDWQKTVDGIANERLRKKAQKRLNTGQEEFAAVKASLKLAGEKFAPFLSDLGDIQKALAADVTVGGVKAIRSTVNKANWDHESVEKAAGSALQKLRAMRKGLSSEAE